MEGDMYGETFHDCSKKFCCPICRNEDSLRFVHVPEHRREFTGDDGSKNVEIMPKLRDYTCGDCEFQWAMDVEQE